MDEFKYDSSASSTEGYESGYEPQECSRSDSGRFSDNAANPGPAPRHGEPVDEQAQPTPAVSPQQAALQLLLDAGIDRKRAQTALQSTEERFRQCGGRPANWAEEALIWLAIDQEHEDESAKLAAGMEESLLESQKTAEACVPPESMTFQELFERFRESPLVTRLAPDRSAAAARCSAGRDGAPELASYLLMERRCRRWYAAAAAYYERAAERLAALLGRPDTPPSPEQWAAFLAGVGEVEGEVKAAVFAMPTEDARVSVPEIFAGQEMDVEVIDLTE